MKRLPNATTDTLEAAGGSPAPHRLTTDRLVLHRAHPDDLEFDRLHALFGDLVDPADVFELCGWEKHDEKVETERYLDQRAEAWERGDTYEYVFATKTDGEYAGTACLEVSEDGSGEFGIWLRKPYWGRGLSGEGTDALVHIAFECLDAPFVVAGCLPENDRSRRAIEKFVRRYGGAYYGSPPVLSSRERHASEAAVPHHEWVITSDQFASRQAGLSTLLPGVEYDDLDF